ncbi:asparagine synthase, glutamine-hydrolyzing [Owenweeksia hongkongensis DSM 17368]|uniref:asparagine synthase (glutamine-hydrolyzing) n=1 Tax=Owenweeksia hongkongensis (strain DSM 17368 / CIP 108786 / JCM 12287 / NRRL B-23963 / UST20020801) TaxID=926562 RepID=G8R508_OWEHD|nr:asparagine synthase (glutamine-hydrolyzing) [Owenweeksia hongkongensis]AEV34322.1 asparagine synthase, glutamine-hydrolyzing [Owenweeksia hongkongensis DSM 17368]
MCGIAGFCDFTKSLDKSVLSKMTDEIKHRGPDSSGNELYELRNANVGFGHRRLSILDLSEAGNQPMHKGSLSIIFNGEIYNFQTIKSELELKGHTFKSNSDTEVVLAAYVEYGMGALEKFIGMFSFAIFDRDKSKVFLVRDRVGVKPLFVFQNEKAIIFGSELKSFHKNALFEKKLDTDSLALYLKYNYVPAPHCIFKNTKKLQPGHYIEINLDNREINEVKYWDVIDDAYNQPKLDVSYKDAVNETEKILDSAFNYRMVADVPVGVFLSGGYDSTAVAALVQKNRKEKVKTFTIGFKEAQYNEAEEAKKIARHLGTDHTELYCTPNEARDILSSIPDIYDEPFADNSVVPTILVCKLASESVKVVLSGDGGDEIFAGYGKFKQAINFTNNIPNWLQSTLAGGMSLINPEKIPYLSGKYNFPSRYEKMINIWKSHSPYVAMKNISSFITDAEVGRLLNIEWKEKFTYFDIAPLLNDSNDDLNKLLAIDYRTFLMDNNLVKVDRASMSVSIEGREPFLDQRIIEYVGRLPSEYKIREGRTKALLKDVVHRYVPKEMMDRPKMPFIAPLTIWFRKEMKDLLIDHLSEESLVRHGLFNIQEVIKLRDSYLSGKPVSHQKVWNILLFQIWYDRYF